MFFFIFIGIQKKPKKWTASRPSKVYKTKAMEAVIEMVNNNAIVTVIGPHGSGKTTLLKKVAVKMEEQGYTLVLAKSARDINQFYNENTKQCFIFDDVCGKRDVKMSLLDDWITFSDEILLILAEEKVKILVGSRSSVYKHPSFKKSLILRKSPYIIPTFSDEEKDGIALYYMNEQEVERLFVEGHIHKIINFLFCLHYHVKFTLCFDLRSFISIDVFVVKSELMSLKKAQDQSMFAVLMLFVFLNNHLNVELLSINFDYFDISRCISDNFAFFLPKVHHYMYNKRFYNS